MKEHDLKCWPEPFKALVADLKTFEWRKNDRDYQVGDVLHLREWDPGTKEYTGRDIRMAVTYIMHKGDFEIHEGYCIMSIRRAGTEQDKLRSRILKRLEQLWARSSAGCCLHIIVEDGNLLDAHVEFCIKKAMQQGHSECEALARDIRMLTESQRRVILGF